MIYHNYSIRTTRRRLTRRRATADGSGRHVGKGHLGSALMGSLQISCFSAEGLFEYPRVKLLLSSQKCQGVPFSSILQRPHSC